MFDLRTRYHATVLVRILFHSVYGKSPQQIREVVNLLVREDIFCWPGEAKLEPEARDWASSFLRRKFTRDNNLRLDCFRLWEIIDIISRTEAKTQQLFFIYYSFLPAKDTHDYFPSVANPFPELFQLVDKSLLP